MKRSFVYLGLISAFLQSFSVGANGASMVEQAKDMAQKDYQSAMAKIESAHKADMLECGRHEGAAAKACEIQVNGKHTAAEDQAKLTRDRAGPELPLASAERKKAAKHQLRIAKISYGIDKARIAKEDKQAKAQCNEIKDEERNTCNLEVTSRTNAANRDAKASYDRSVAKAKGIGLD